MRAGLAMLLLAACAAEPRHAHVSKAHPAADGGEPSSDSGEDAAAPEDDGACQRSPQPLSGALSIMVNGSSRNFELVLPDGYDGQQRFPVIFAWHGTGSTGLDFLDRDYGSFFDGAAGRAILVAPDGLIEYEGPWTGLTRWQLSEFDGAFFDLLLDRLNREYCIDAQRVFSTGHSIGAYFSNYLGCTRGDRLRAIAPVAGGGPLDTSDCVGHPAVLIAHNPDECSEPNPPECPFAVPWADTGWPSLQFWADRDGCEPLAEMPTKAYDGTPPCRPLAGCDESSPVTLCLYDFRSSYAGPHAWPTPWMAGAIVDWFLSLP